jgi:hypothetical protein
MKDDKLKEMIKDSLNKLEETAFLDSKLLTEMNNALSWILTLTTVLFVYYSKFFDGTLSCYELVATNFGKVLFLVSLGLFLIHKISLLQYEKIKGLYQKSLRTHALELKYDLNQLRKNIPSTGISIFDFINHFRNGKLIPHPTLDDREKHFKKYDRTISILGLILKLSFWIEIGVFIIFVTGATFLIF